MPFRFTAADRIRKQADYDRIYKSRLFAADDVLVINADVNGLNRTRLGLSVSRKVGGAVVRNRWKRLLREAFRLSRDSLPSGLDLVIRPQKGAAPDFHAIRTSLIALAHRISKRLARKGG
jgi:ribonuclease P protein component